jgi:TrfB plasmid transcriptional repressor
VKLNTPSLKPRKKFAPGKRRLTAEQFDEVRPHLARLNEDRIMAARMALVDDLPLDSIAKHFGWTARQTVSSAVTGVFAAIARMEKAQLMATDLGVLNPPGWEAVTFLAPPSLIATWRKELAVEVGKVFAAAHGTQVSAVNPKKRPSTSAAAAARLGHVPIKSAALDGGALALMQATQGGTFLNLPVSYDDSAPRPEDLNFEAPGDIDC